jgi:hypothetical protein
MDVGTYYYWDNYLKGLNDFYDININDLSMGNRIKLGVEIESIEDKLKPFK